MVLTAPTLATNKGKIIIGAEKEELAIGIIVQ